MRIAIGIWNAIGVLISIPVALMFFDLLGELTAEVLR